MAKLAGGGDADSVATAVPVGLGDVAGADVGGAGVAGVAVGAGLAQAAANSSAAAAWSRRSGRDIGLVGDVIERETFENGVRWNLKVALGGRVAGIGGHHHDVFANEDEVGA